MLSRVLCFVHTVQVCNTFYNSWKCCTRVVCTQLHTAHGNMNFVQEFYLSRQGVARNLQCGGGGSLCPKTGEDQKTKKRSSTKLGSLFRPNCVHFKSKNKTVCCMPLGGLFSIPVQKSGLKCSKRGIFHLLHANGGGGGLQPPGYATVLR